MFFNLFVRPFKQLHETLLIVDIVEIANQLRSTKHAQNPSFSALDVWNLNILR